MMPYVSFECALCYKVAELPIDSREKLDEIREEVETSDGLSLNSMAVCEDIECFSIITVTGGSSWITICDNIRGILQGKS